MSLPLDALEFPLHGARLIEASAGTGKTWTIAALYVRLVLGHGGANGFGRPLLPSEILVMTFTRAATRELTERIRARLVEAAACFRGRAPAAHDDFLRALIKACAGEEARQQAAHRLAMAAEAMDECAIFTIDAWCQRMLREHAFDSGSLFDEELIAGEQALFHDAVRDYWRVHVYPLQADQLREALACWPGLAALENSAHALLGQGALLPPQEAEPLAHLMRRIGREQLALAAALKAGWPERIARIADWFAANRSELSGTTLRAATVAGWLQALREWAADPGAVRPDAVLDKAWDKLAPAALEKSVNKGCRVTPSDDFGELAALRAALAALEPMRHFLLRHAGSEIARRIAELKRRSGQIGFADMLARLRAALEGENGAALARCVVERYPVALIDEFQDTSPDQYRIFDLLYRIADNRPQTGLFLIGDPKQAIYGFRGADIRSYLTARAATEGRHYLLATNFRSTAALVEAVNRLFLHAEGDAGQAGYPRGAFRFRTGAHNPLPFEAVRANGRAERLVGRTAPAALTLWCNDDAALSAEGYRSHFAARCAQAIVELLNDDEAGFEVDGRRVPLRPADIAVLVRDQREAAAVRQALQRRRVASVYLSDKDSVFDGVEAADMLVWLQAVAAPLAGSSARAAFATRTAGLSLDELAHLAADDLAWEARVEQLKALRLVWQRQGVLAMLRRFIHELGLPARLLAQTGGERSLTDLLHLSELLQAAAQQLDGEQALIRWLAEQTGDDDEGGDERILRLESDAELVQVITVHKSKGLEYPLVFLPFAVSARPVTRRKREFFAYADAHGATRIDFAMGEEARKAVNEARIDEDVRLLYVALTRARHALWLGVASLGDNVHEAALGYLLGGGTPIPAAVLAQQLQAMAGPCAAIRIDTDATAPAHTLLARPDQRAALIEAARFGGTLERNWRIASYTSISSDLGPAPASQLAEKLLEGEDRAAPGKRQDAAWHRFARGPLAGQFLHEQLEWLAREGFAGAGAAQFDARLAARCERAGWGQRQDDALDWLRAATQTLLPPLGVALAGLEGVVPEMEFWLPADGLDTAALDRLCCAHILPGLARPPLSERQLHGMLRGFMDLVFEHEGRYWVLDYKSNALANDDAGYHAQALAAGMLGGRYDVQGAIYLLALHRLLASRLGAAYDPARQLGGALFFFLRGLAHPDTRGCHCLAPEPALLDALARLLPIPDPLEDAA